jgi:hypothetical protein
VPHAEMQLYFLQSEQMVAHVGQRVLTQRVGEADKFAIVFIVAGGAMSAGVAMVVLGPRHR